MVIHESSKFQYIHWDPKFLHEKPYQILSGHSEHSSVSRTNITYAPSAHEEKITDIRENPSLYNLDRNGFSVHLIESDFSEWGNRDKVENEYIPKVVVPFLKQHVDVAGRVVIFDWRLRRNDNEKSGPVDMADGTVPIKPAKVVHVDQTPLGVVRRVRQQLGDQAEEALRGRVRLVNFWKPLHYAVQDSPLAVCDGSLVTPEDLVAIDLVRKSYIGETAFLLPSPKLKWHYLSNQETNEALLIKIFDSDSEVPAKSCPHASFTPSGNTDGARPRQSIEVRALILSDV